MFKLKKKIRTGQFLLLRKMGYNIHFPLRKGKKTNFVFIHIPKTAGTSIANLIGLYHKKHSTVKMVKQMLGLDWYRAFKFTIVRNPYDRIVSQYEHRKNNNYENIFSDNMSFENWVTEVYKFRNPKFVTWDIGFITQKAWLKNEDGEVDIDYIVKFENLQHEMKKICQIIGINGRLEHKNATNRKNYKAYYSIETKKIIEDFFEEDFEFFDYPIEKF